MSISLLKEEQRTSLKAFLDDKDVFDLLPSDFGQHLIYQLTAMVVWFVDLIVLSNSAIDSDRQMVYPITCHVFVGLSFFQTVSNVAFTTLLCVRKHQVQSVQQVMSYATFPVISPGNRSG